MLTLIKQIEILTRKSRKLISIEDMVRALATARNLIQRIRSEDQFDYLNDALLLAFDIAKVCSETSLTQVQTPLINVLREMQEVFKIAKHSENKLAVINLILKITDNDELKSISESSAPQTIIPIDFSNMHEKLHKTPYQYPVIKSSDYLTLEHEFVSLFVKIQKSTHQDEYSETLNTFYNKIRNKNQDSSFSSLSQDKKIDFFELAIIVQWVYLQYSPKIQKNENQHHTLNELSKFCRLLSNEVSNQGHFLLEYQSILSDSQVHSTTKDAFLANIISKSQALSFETQETVEKIKQDLSQTTNEKLNTVFFSKVLEGMLVRQSVNRIVKILDKYSANPFTSDILVYFWPKRMTSGQVFMLQVEFDQLLANEEDCQRLLNAATLYSSLMHIKQNYLQAWIPLSSEEASFDDTLNAECYAYLLSRGEKKLNDLSYILSETYYLSPMTYFIAMHYYNKLINRAPSDTFHPLPSLESNNSAIEHNSHKNNSDSKQIRDDIQQLQRAKLIAEREKIEQQQVNEQKMLDLKTQMYQLTCKLDARWVEFKRTTLRRCEEVQAYADARKHIVASKTQLYPQDKKTSLKKQKPINKNTTNEEQRKATISDMAAYNIHLYQLQIQHIESKIQNTECGAQPTTYEMEKYSIIMSALRDIDLMLNDPDIASHPLIHFFELKAAFTERLSDFTNELRAFISSARNNQEQIEVFSKSNLDETMAQYEKGVSLPTSEITNALWERAKQTAEQRGLVCFGWLLRRINKEAFSTDMFIKEEGYLDDFFQHVESVWCIQKASCFYLALAEKLMTAYEIDRALQILKKIRTIVKPRMDEAIVTMLKNAHDNIHRAIRESDFRLNEAAITISKAYYGMLIEINEEKENTASRKRLIKTFYRTYLQQTLSDLEGPMAFGFKFFNSIAPQPPSDHHQYSREAFFEAAKLSVYFEVIGKFLTLFLQKKNFTCVSRDNLASLIHLINYNKINYILFAINLTHSAQKTASITNDTIIDGIATYQFLEKIISLRKDKPLDQYCHQTIANILKKLEEKRQEIERVQQEKLIINTETLKQIHQQISCPPIDFDSLKRVAPIFNNFSDGIKSQLDAYDYDLILAQLIAKLEEGHKNECEEQAIEKGIMFFMAKFKSLWKKFVLEALPDEPEIHTLIGQLKDNIVEAEIHTLITQLKVKENIHDGCPPLEYTSRYRLYKEGNPIPITIKSDTEVREEYYPSCNYGLRGV